MINENTVTKWKIVSLNWGKNGLGKNETSSSVLWYHRIHQGCSSVTESQAAPPLPGPDTHIHSPAFEQRFTQNTQKHSILTATKHSPTRRLTMWNNCSFSFSFFLSSFFSLVVPGVFHLTTEISRESSQKIQKMLNLRNVSHSTEDSTKFSRAKLNRNKPFAIAFFKNP